MKVVKVTVELPRVGRRRLVATYVLGSVATALWMYGAVQLCAPSLVRLHIVVAFTIPFGVGWVTLLLMERRIARDMVRTAWVAQEEPRREELVQR